MQKGETQRIIKAAVIIGLVVLALLISGILLHGCATTQPPVKSVEVAEPTFTWQGELNPNEFDDESKWQYVNSFAQPPFYWTIIKNLDESSPIEHVALLMDLQSNLRGYRYFKSNEPQAYFFNPASNCYERYEYTAEEKQGCFQCHSDKAKAKRTSI